jgi:hypothetical protein
MFRQSWLMTVQKDRTRIEKDKETTEGEERERE